MTFHIRRFDRQFSRREFLRIGSGFVGAGLLMPVWAAMEKHGEANAAYPEELRSIEDYTGGKLKAGDFIDAGNVELVKELLGPVTYMQVKEMGRRLKLRATTTDIMKLSPWEYLEASFRHRGQARFDADGNVGRCGVEVAAVKVTVVVVVVVNVCGR